jgi:hypothetical protein
MVNANTLVMRRAVILWVGAGLLMGFNIYAASQRSPALIYWALALTGAFALFGIAFGIWAARKITAPRA